MSKAKPKATEAFFKIDLGDGRIIHVYDNVAFAPDEGGKCVFWIDGDLYDFQGLTGRQQIDFLNRLGTCWTAMFKRSRKKATVEQFEADLAG